MSRNATAHATSEDLSAFLDRELEPPRLRLVETHLEECEECRRRVDGLSRVVRDLRRLERFDPPPALGQHFMHRLHGSSRPKGFLQRVEERLDGRNLQSPIGFSFALVLAFSALLYFFAGSLDRHQRSQTAILRPMVVPETVASETASPAPRRDVGSRTFLWQGGVWWQEGLAQDASPAEVTTGSTHGQQILNSNPELEALLEEGESVVLEVAGSVLLLRSPPPSQE